MKVKLAYVIYTGRDDVPTLHDMMSFNTKKGAQMYDRFLKETYGDDIVMSRIIYDDGE